MPIVVGFIPEDKPTKREQEIGRANRLCGTMWGLHPIALQPKGVVMTYRRPRAAADHGDAP